MLDYDWKREESGNAHPDDLVDFHVDLGCGTIPKARIGVDRYATPDVPDLRVCNLDDVNLRLPFEDGEVESIITHHCFEHIGDGFHQLMYECWRVLKDDGLLRIIVPCFPSKSSVSDTDHRRWLMPESFMAYCGTPGDTDQNCWLASFSVPYVGLTRFEQTDVDYTALDPNVDAFEQVRELRVSLRARKV